MLTLAESGVKVIPPVPAWYTNPIKLDDMITFIVVRLFDSIGEDLGNINRWTGRIK